MPTLHRRRPLDSAFWHPVVGCCPQSVECGHWNSVYKRYYAAWRVRGIWTALHLRLAADPDTECLIINGVVIRAHPDAS